jgi:hypothetical protein
MFRPQSVIFTPVVLKYVIYVMYFMLLARRWSFEVVMCCQVKDIVAVGRHLFALQKNLCTVQRTIYGADWYWEVLQMWMAVEGHGYTAVEDIMIVIIVIIIIIIIIIYWIHSLYVHVYRDY